MTTVVTIDIQMAPMRAVVKDAAGNIVPQPAPPTPVWHGSLRYFRLAQVTDDLFDAYRNLYLALEAILDRIAPQTVNAAGKPNEPEGQWFKRALGEAHKRVPLNQFAPKGSAGPVQDLHDELYVGTRTALFHAKGSRSSFLPHVPGKEQENVRAVVARLARLYIALAENELNTRSVMSGLFAPGFDILTKHLIPKFRLQATDDRAADNPDNEVLNPTGGAVIDLQTRHAPELERPFLRAFHGTATGTDAAGLERLSVIAAKVDDKLVCYGSVEGELVLAGVGRLEAQLSIRHRNAQLPRAHFAS